MKCETCQAKTINTKNRRRYDALLGYVEKHSKKVCINCGSSEIFVQKVKTGKFIDYGGRELVYSNVKEPSQVRFTTGYNAPLAPIILCWKCKKALARLDWKTLLKRKIKRVLRRG